MVAEIVQTPSDIKVEIKNGIGWLTIDRRKRFNSFDVTTARDFRHAGLRLARDEEVRCVVIQGSGGVFCSGADLKYIRGGGDREGLGYLKQGRDCPEGYGEVFKQILEYLHSTISEIRRAPKPFVAAVDGVAAAGGFGIAMACDLVIISERAIFQWAYHKTGLTGAESSTFLLPKLLGLRRAMGLMLLDPQIDAQRALELGLVNRVLSAEEFESGVLEIASQIASGPTRAYAVTKQLINASTGVDRLDFHLDRELDELSRIADGEDFGAGLDAFFEKRSAQFTGEG